VESGSPVDLVVSGGASALTVPNVTNQTEAAAIFTLQQEGFDLAQIVIERRPHADILEGFVIETDPPAGEVVPSDGTLILIVSEGAVPSVVPNVIGLEPEEAQERLEEFGFVVSFGPVFPLDWDDPNDGKIADQNPAPGETHEFGSQVTIRIGRAATEVTVPNVDGATVSAARTAIRDAGLVFERGADTLVAPGSADINRAVSQNPGAGTTQDVGTTVVVSFGKEGAQVPNLFTGGGSDCPDAVTLATAQSRITAANLVMSAQTASEDEYSYTFGNHECEGRTVQQSPPPNDIVEKGSTVVVMFDPVFAPLDFEIYELMPTGPPASKSAEDQFPVFTWEQATQNGGECHDPDPAYSGNIRRIDPEPEEVIPLIDGKYTIEYWVAVNNPLRPSCPPYTPPP